MQREQIKALALANGFKLKTQPDGSEDLNPYVYEFAEALMAPLQAEVERLQEGDKQADFTRMNLLIEKKIQIEKLERERDQLKAVLQQFMALNQHDRDLPLELFAIQRSVSAKAVSLANRDAEVIERAFITAYKSGFDHGLQCDKAEIENANRTSSAIRIFDYQLQRIARSAADQYIRQQAKEVQS